VNGAFAADDETYSRRPAAPLRWTDAVLSEATYCQLPGLALDDGHALTASTLGEAPVTRPWSIHSSPARYFGARRVSLAIMLSRPARTRLALTKLVPSC
jgi:hypothetical protein